MGREAKPAIEVAEAVLRGAGAVFVDFGYGLERLWESAGGSGGRRQADIANENEYVARLLHASVRHGTSSLSPLYKIIKTILLEYYAYFPTEVLIEYAKCAGVAVAKASGHVVGKQIGKRLAQHVAQRAVVAIASSAAFKQLAARLGVAAGTGATGVGLLVSLPLYAGVVQRASRASSRLQQSNPALWRLLRQQDGLDMLYFLVEKPLAKHLAAIELARQDPAAFVSLLATRYQLEYHTVVRGESLSKIAQVYYNDMHQWPVIYEANKKVIGDNPNLIHPGQRLYIPSPQGQAARDVCRVG